MISRVFWSYLILFSCGGGGGDEFISAYSAGQDPAAANRTRSSQHSQHTLLNQLSKRFNDVSWKLDPDLSPTCLKHLTDLKKQSKLAVIMKSATQWDPINKWSIQNKKAKWRECMSIKERNIKGKFCLVYAEYELNDQPLQQSNDSSDLSEKYPLLVDEKIPSGVICVPKSCGSADLRILLKHFRQKLPASKNLSWSLNVVSTHCSTKLQPGSTTGHILVSSFLTVIGVLVLMSTVYDLLIKCDRMGANAQRNRIWLQLFDAFSLIRNYKKLSNVLPNSEHPILHFIKVITLFFVIYENRLVFPRGHPESNIEKETTMAYPQSTDAFFALSGFLLFHYGFEPILNDGFFFLVISIIVRWIRMIPVFIILALVVIFMLPFTSEGPIWSYHVMREVENCESSLLTNVLAMGNVIGNDKQCLLPGWYISVDMQLAVVGVILLLVVTKCPKFGFCVTMLVYFGSVGITLVIVRRNHFHGLLSYANFWEDPRDSSEYNNFHVATYTRIGPYLTGFVAAFLARIQKEGCFELTVVQTIIGFCLTTALHALSRMYELVLDKHGGAYNALEHGLYSAISRTFYVLPYAFVMFACCSSGFDKLNKFMAWKRIVPFGRLVHCSFLTSYLVQFCRYTSHEMMTPTEFFGIKVFQALIDTFFSFVFGFLLHMFLEAPLLNISTLMQKKMLSVVTQHNDSRSDGSDNRKSSNQTKTSIEINNFKHKLNQRCYDNEAYENNSYNRRQSHSSH